MGGIATKLIREKYEPTTRLNAKAIAFLEEILEYNDRVINVKRIGRVKAITTLREEFKIDIGRTALDSICAYQLGRKSFTEK
jgi:hypothetical protein